MGAVEGVVTNAVVITASGLSESGWSVRKVLGEGRRTANVNQRGGELLLGVASMALDPSNFRSCWFSNVLWRAAPVLLPSLCPCPGEEGPWRRGNYSGFAIG